MTFPRLGTQMHLGGYMNRAAKKRPWCNIFHGSQVCDVTGCCMLFPLHACESHFATHKGCANHTCLEQTRKEASWLGVEQGIWILKAFHWLKYVLYLPSAPLPLLIGYRTFVSFPVGILPIYTFFMTSFRYPTPCSYWDVRQISGNYMHGML